MKRIIVVLFVIIGFSSAIAVADDKTGTGTVSGVIMLKDSGPMADVIVLFFSDSLGPPPVENRYMRLPDIIANTDSKGFFSAALPAGKYYVGGKKDLVLLNKWHGPPRDGDLFFISRDEEDAPALYIVKAGEHLNISIAVEDRPYEWPDVRDGVTGIEGRIHDVNGNPVEDAAVLGFSGSEMRGEGPAFASGYTDSEGKYLLRVHNGGKYYLRVRGEFGTITTVSGMKIKHGAEGDEQGINVTTGKIVSNIDIEIKITVR